MRRSGVLLLMILGCGRQTLAETIHYDIQFAVYPDEGVDDVATPPTSSFDYDPDAGFSNFIVSWDGYTFDVSSGANAPDVSGSPCPGISSTPAESFNILNDAVAGDCTAQTQLWYGVTIPTNLPAIGQFAFGNTFEHLFFGTPSFPITAAQAPKNFGGGSFSISISNTPEPATGVYLIAGLLLSVLLRPGGINRMGRIAGVYRSKRIRKY